MTNKWEFMPKYMYNNELLIVRMAVGSGGHCPPSQEITLAQPKLLEPNDLDNLIYRLQDIV